MEGKYHFRSISLPSRSHPTTLRIEDELNKLKTWESLTLTGSESICASLSGLEGLYQSMNDLLNMASTQQALSMQDPHEKCIDELLEGSLRILDICGIARDYMFQIKEHVQSLESAFRRKNKGDSSIENSILKYNSLRKKMKKQGKKLINELKHINNKLTVASPLVDHDDHLSALIRVLREVDVINSIIFQSLFSFLSASGFMKQSRWSMVSKLIGKREVSCEENVNELEMVDAALCRQSFNFDKTDIAQKRLVTLESSIECIENRLECVFRHLIKARTSLLNIISQ